MDLKMVLMRKNELATMPAFRREQDLGEAHKITSFILPIDGEWVMIT